MQSNNSFKIGDLIEMQLALNEVASGIVIDVDTRRYDYEFPPIKIHWFSGPDWHRSQLAVGTVAGMQVTWQNPSELELVSRGHKNQ